MWNNLTLSNYKGIFFHDDVVEPLKPILEDWLGLRLSEEDIAMFGIRFLRGAWMSLFADPYPAHAFGIILQVLVEKRFFYLLYLPNLFDNFYIKNMHILL